MCCIVNNNTCEEYITPFKRVLLLSKDIDTDDEQSRRPTTITRPNPGDHHTVTLV